MRKFFIDFLTDSFYEKIKEAAWRARLSMSEWLRRAAQEKLERDEKTEK